MEPKVVRREELQPPAAASSDAADAAPVSRIPPPPFARVYEEHFAFVWRALRRLGMHDADVADAVQDVFVVVHAKLAEFEGRSKLTTWLFAICLRVARDRRKRAHVRAEVADGLLAHRVDERCDVAAEAEHRQRIRVLDAILDEMPLEQRAVFALFELEGLTGEQIAELVQVPLGTVYSRLRLAREAFRRSVARRKARDASVERVAEFRRKSEAT